MTEDYRQNHRHSRKLSWLKTEYRGSFYSSPVDTSQLLAELIPPCGAIICSNIIFPQWIHFRAFFPRSHFQVDSSKFPNGVIHSPVGLSWLMIRVQVCPGKCPTLISCKIFSLLKAKKCRMLFHAKTPNEAKRIPPAESQKVSDAISC